MDSSFIGLFVKKIVEETLKHTKSSFQQVDEVVQTIMKELTTSSSSVLSQEADEDNVRRQQQHVPQGSTSATATATAATTPMTPTANIQAPVVRAENKNKVLPCDLVSPVQKPITHEECGLYGKNTKFAAPLPSYLLNDPSNDEEDGDVNGNPPTSSSAVHVSAPSLPNPVVASKSSAAAAAIGTTKKATKTLVAVSEPPSVDEVIEKLKNCENIKFCLRLLSRGQKVGKICGEVPSVGTEYCEYKQGMSTETRISSIMCKKCSSLQQKNPLLKLVSSSSSVQHQPKPATAAGSKKDSSASGGAGKKKAASAVAVNKNDEEDDKKSVESGLPDDLSGLPVFSGSEEDSEDHHTKPAVEDAEEEDFVNANAAAASATEAETAAAAPQTPKPSTPTPPPPLTKKLMATVSSPSADELKNLGLESVICSQNEGLFITKSKISKDAYRLVVLYSATSTPKFVIVGRITKPDYEEYLFDCSEGGDSLIDILEEVSTEEEALDLLLDNKIIHYRYKNEGDVAVFEENDDA